MMKAQMMKILRYNTNFFIQIFITGITNFRDKHKKIVADIKKSLHTDRHLINVLLPTSPSLDPSNSIYSLFRTHMTIFTHSW